MLAIETYEILKFFHILFAIIAVGSTLPTGSGSPEPRGSATTRRSRCEV